MRKFNTSRIRRQTAYDVQEIRDLLGVHKNTVREWLRQGLPKIENRRPYLILGKVLKTFLDNRRKGSRKKCAPNELYCLRCRCPRRPMGNMADLEQRNAKIVMLKGLCELCGTLMHKVQSLKFLPKLLQIFDIPKEQQERLVDCLSSSLNCDLEEETQT